ncbi:hypothetical protein RJT34_19569 [Clitoria ternatea]|uniref:Uncharacterized protein n=1 Tax=Clitoria ternatea TaxID=43366 RepID=A0AAN9IRI8_CLITE
MNNKHCEYAKWLVEEEARYSGCSVDIWEDKWIPNAFDYKLHSGFDQASNLYSSKVEELMDMNSGQESSLITQTLLI